VFQDCPGICQFVPLDHHPAPTDLRLHFFLAVLLVSSTSVPSAICSFDSLASFQVLLFLSSLCRYPYRLVYHLSSFAFFSLPSLPFSFTSSFIPFSSSSPTPRVFHRFFFPFLLTDSSQISFPVDSQKNHGDPEISFTRLNPGIRSGSHPRREAQHFSMKYHGCVDKTYPAPHGRQASVLSGTFLDGLMITEKLSWSRKKFPLGSPYFVEFFNF